MVVVLGDSVLVIEIRMLVMVVDNVLVLEAIIVC